MSVKALVVDDSLTVRMDLTEALKGAGLEVVACTCLAEGRAALKEHRFALAVLDVMLPDGEGTTLLEELRHDPQHARTTVMMLSTEAEVRDRVRGLSRGADEYVGKPYDSTYLVTRAQELLRRAGVQQGDSRTSVLVIEDSPTYRAEVTEALEQNDYRVIGAETTAEGLRLAAVLRPQAIIVDGVLPDGDGAMLVRKLRLDAALRATPCLMLTGSHQRGFEVEALEAGADDYMDKSTDLGVLVTRLHVLLRRRRPELPALDTESLASPKKILAVDDSPTYLQSTIEALSGSGYEVVTAHTGEEALELLAVQKVDCVLLDVEMPGIDGRETCRRIKASADMREIPVILVTADGSRDAMSEGLSAGADDFVVKSSEMQVLRARVLAQLRRKQVDDERRRVGEELLKRELAEARAESAAELERKNQELEAFSYSVSHDLRAPLRSIMGFTSALSEDSGHLLDTVGKEHLQRVLAAATRMNQLIDDLLSLSRIGRGELQRKSADVSELARDVLAELKAREPSRKVEVDVEPGLTASADPALVKVLLENVLGNAWKFTSKKEGARIEVKTIESAEGRAFVVRDNGAGFDGARAAKKLFAPFQRMHHEREFPGTGIGLATVRRVVEKHGGKVWVEAEVEKGAAVFFTLGA